MRTERASVSTTCTGRSRLASGNQLSASRAAKNMSARSLRSRRSTPGRSTLTATIALAPVGVDHLGPMHLRDRGGGDRLAELDEQARQRRLERGLDALHRDLARQRRDAVLQPLQLARDLVADDVGPGGEELAELHIGRTQPLHGARQPVAARPLAPDQLERAEQRAGRSGGSSCGVDAGRTRPRGPSRNPRRRAARRDLSRKKRSSVRASSRNGSRRRRR